MRLSAGFACHHCDEPAPTGKGGFFTYLTMPDREDAEKEPSCAEHATHSLVWTEQGPDYRPTT